VETYGRSSWNKPAENTTTKPFPEVAEGLPIGCCKTGREITNQKKKQKDPWVGCYGMAASGSAVASFNEQTLLTTVSG